jgi:hypothetical protein
MHGVAANSMIDLTIDDDFEVAANSVIDLTGNVIDLTTGDDFEATDNIIDLTGNTLMFGYGTIDLTDA